MFKRILIANRGEVALRIARTARALGIQTVGVCSSAERGASWLRHFDEHVCLGGPAPRESYLRPDAIVQAALQTGASAIHPGWGFLAENPRFAALCAQHGITFVGPSAALMTKMGLKSPAKAAMKAAGLPVIPGSDGLLESAEEAQKLADAIGYPVIVKADAGGGGRGMRLVREASALREAYASASAEAAAAFGNGALYLEKYLSGGRHIEVQILADRYGRALHLFERECSIQRNHQKLIEESPSPALSPKEREELGAMSARAAAAIGYTNAGTIEYLKSAEGPLYFMEMNTRLQVEHPVTEMLTGLDIVKLQLEIAANEPLRIAQGDVKSSGHAIECRINAEDPSNEFRPAPGVLKSFAIPFDRGPGNVRVETYLEAGDEIPPYYDSLIAKVIAHGNTREEAIATMLRTLGESKVEGVPTTIPLHLAVLASAEFRDGKYDTRTIPGWKSAARA
ncbi:MAG: acetyl-CoA carboxylase biotin carboxylase subunit [Planctomycetes bacterium]|nr:acetyl-CoA carboxylase biotin carboxylase subunit [Planctomycetota bacterium]